MHPQRPPRSSGISTRRIGDTPVGRNPFNTGLPSVKAGDLISPNSINSLSQGIDKITIRSGNGYRVKQTSGGTVLELTQPDFGVTKSIPPLTPYLGMTSFEGDSVQGIFVTIGSVNNYIPKLNNKYLDDQEQKPAFIVAGIGSGKVYVRAARNEDDTFFPSKVTIEYYEDADANSLKDTNDAGFYMLADVRIVTPDNGGDKKVTITPMSTGCLVVNRTRAGANEAVWTWGVYPFYG